MILRPFTSDDAAAILSWCKDKRAFRLWSADRYKDFPASTEEMMQQYSGDRKFPLTAVVEGEIVGHILLRYPSDDDHLIRFGFVIVNDSRRGMGYGKQMIQMAVDYAEKNLDAELITLGVFTDNTPAIECYKTAGFHITGESKYLIDGEEWRSYEMALDNCNGQ